MIVVGLDDTDLPDTPGTNQLARHLIRAVADRFTGTLIVRHQLFFDPRVPYTSKNGSASIYFAEHDGNASELIQSLRPMILQWSPAGSDPGLCVAETIPAEVTALSLRCQCEIVRQNEALEVARAAGIHLEGLAGTGDGLIGALAAVGLFATGDDGRVVHSGPPDADRLEISGVQTLSALSAAGVEEIRHLDSLEMISRGEVDVGKRLRPNRRGGKIVLLVRAAEDRWSAGPRWQAVKTT